MSARIEERIRVFWWLGNVLAAGRVLAAGSLGVSKGALL
jgi:hypothetical protein